MREIDRTTTCFYLAAVFMAACVVTAMLASPALAAKEPSAENCEKLNPIEVRCTVCATGEVKGKLTIKPLYDAAYGDCLGHLKDARERCSSSFDIPEDETGVFGSHWMGGEEYKSWYPSACEH